MARAAPDMKFGQPIISKQLIESAGTGIYPLSRYFQMQGAVGDDEGEEEEMIPLVPTSVPDYPVMEVLFGEDFKSVRPFFQKFSLIDVYAIATSGYYQYPHLYPPPAETLYAGTPVVDISSGIGGTPNWTWIMHYGMMFVGMRGSTRYKGVCRDASRLVAAGAGLLGDTESMGHYPPFNGSPAGAALVDTGVAMNTTSGRGVEFLIPYYGTRKWVAPRWVEQLGAGFPNSRRDFISVTTVEDDAADKMWLYMAGGPDTAVNRFRRTPTVILPLFTP
jgi:hypothetical protein